MIDIFVLLSVLAVWPASMVWTHLELRRPERERSRAFRLFESAFRVMAHAVHRGLTAIGVTRHG